MLFSRKFMIVSIVLCGLLLISPLGMAKKKIDVEKEVMDYVNAHPKLIKKLIKKVFNETVNGNDYKMVEFTISNMKQITSPEIDLMSLPEEWVFVTATEVVQCADTDTLHETISLTGETTTTKTITKTMNFSYSYSGSVGMSILFVSGSATQTWNAGYSQSWTDTETEKHSATKSTEVTIPTRGGRVVTLLSKHLQGTIPYEAKYTIANNSVINMKFRGKAGQVKVCEHVNYGGNCNSYKNGREISQLPDILHDKISSLRVPGGLKAILYQHKNYGGKTKEITSDTNWIGDDFNDKASSMKVERRVFETSVPIIMFGQIKDILPVDAKVFTAKGNIEIDYSFPVPVTRVVSQVMDESYVNEQCTTQYSYSSSSPSKAMAAAGGSSGKKVVKKKLTKAQYDRLKKSGKIK